MGITGFETTDGNKKYDYNSLENIPTNLANTDLDNLTVEGKEKISKLGMPSDDFINYELENLSSSVHAVSKIAPANGYVRVSFYTSAIKAEGDHAILKSRNSDDTDTLLVTSQYTHAGGVGINLFLPVRKNQKFELEYKISGLTSTNYRFRFHKAQGEV